MRCKIYKRDETLPCEWLECRIALRLGDLEETVPRLEALLGAFLHKNKLFESCLCAVDLAWAYAKQDNVQERQSVLLREIARVRGAVEHPWTLGALWRFANASRGARARRAPPGRPVRSSGGGSLVEKPDRATP